MLRKLRRFVKLTVLLAGLILTMTLVAGPGFLAGKMESFREDSLELVKQIELSNTTADILQGRGDMLRADDALRDSCHQPFDSTFRGGFPKCVTFYEALQRAWRKMQMRGLVGAIPFPVTQEQASNITENDFVKLAKEAHGLSFIYRIITNKQRVN
ncbi:hypothetical protein MAR_028640 [Mya arenaria]|uniref:Uncharacterized protein n=1 Tax=Mya arenaria TaxID=6604 RepID=A0ABY7DHY8_MYAAR|nr:hypothetical protein MAR_028640 [Mya arenaria]